MLEQLLSLPLHRPYVAVFLVAFLVLGWLEQGWLRTLLWLVTGYLVALVAEWGSINHGVPFGYYIYHYEALEKDLVVAGVPFFDSLSFAFLSYVSFSTAQYFLSALWVKGRDVQRVTPRRVRNSASALLLGAALMVVIDIVVDPVAHLGKHWFLGEIYHYPSPGYHFNVPLANYAGWFVVGWVCIFINQRLDALLSRREVVAGRRVALRHLPLKGLFAPLFWAGIVGFNLGVTYWLAYSYDLSLLPENAVLRGEWVAEVRTQLVCGCFVAAPVLALAAAQLVKPANRARDEDLLSALDDMDCPGLRRQVEGIAVARPAPVPKL
ncbi:MAG: carotenoid biosynthesis protein [Planctomycetes bacterium]|nr:carotenoid biosynthesis protein [Planctomycetota bacterium]